MLAAKALRDRIGRALDRLGVRIANDPKSHHALSVGDLGGPGEDGSVGKLAIKLIRRPEPQETPMNVIFGQLS